LPDRAPAGWRTAAPDRRLHSVDTVSQPRRRSRPRNRPRWVVASNISPGPSGSSTSLSASHFSMPSRSGTS